MIDQHKNRQQFGVKRFTSELSNEERESDTDWSNESSSVLFRRQHKDREGELSSKKHFNKQTLDDRSTSPPTLSAQPKDPGKAPRQ